MTTSEKEKMIILINQIIYIGIVAGKIKDPNNTIRLFLIDMIKNL